MTGAMMPARGQETLWRETDGSVVLFREDTGRAWVLDSVASGVWLKCDGRTALRAAAASLGLDENELRSALAEFSELGCLAEPGEWGEVSAERRAEEIVFAACDCSTGGRGVMRNAECVNRPLQQVSSI